MCHNSGHIWICHRRNNSAPGNISVWGEIQVRGSVILWARVCVYVRVRACQPPHTLAVKWKKSSAALFCHFSLSVLFSLSLSFYSPYSDSKPCCVLSNSVAMVTVKLWFLLVACWSCHLSCRRGVWQTSRVVVDGQAPLEQHPPSRQNRFAPSRSQIKSFLERTLQPLGNHSFSIWAQPGSRRMQELAIWQMKQQVGSILLRLLLGQR